MLLLNRLLDAIYLNTIAFLELLEKLLSGLEKISLPQHKYLKNMIVNNQNLREKKQIIKIIIEQKKCCYKSKTLPGFIILLGSIVVFICFIRGILSGCSLSK